MLVKVLKIVLPLVVLAVGVVTLVVLVKTKPQAQRAEKEKDGLVVEVQNVQADRHEVAVEARGSIVPAQKVALQPQVNGRIIWQSESLVPGGRFEESETILRIDPSDYELAVESNRAQVSKAQLDLRLERSRKEIAEREWKLFGPDAGAVRSSRAPAQQTEDDADGPPLALREPQVQTARVAVESARSALERAKLNLRRTRLRAPFNALVMEENVDRGQVVGPQTTVATLVGTDHFWVRVAIPVDALPSIDIPNINAERGSSARVIHETGGHRVERSGRVIRLLGNLDEQGTMAQLLVEIDDPLGLKAGDAGEPHVPMLVGSYVKVAIDAHPIDGVFEIPRRALREGSQVYVVDGQRRLRIRDVRIAWRRQDTILISNGLRDGDLVITSGVPTPVEGMRLQLSQDAGDSPQVAKASESDSPPSAAEESGQ